jgi:hypothetical protein
MREFDWNSNAGTQMEKLINLASTCTPFALSPPLKASRRRTTASTAPPSQPSTHNQHQAHRSTHRIDCNKRINSSKLSSQQPPPSRGTINKPPPSKLSQLTPSSPEFLPSILVASKLPKTLLVVTLLFAMYMVSAQNQPQFVNGLLENIRQQGAMDKLISDRATVEISAKVLDVLRYLQIDSWQSEPYMQNQNFAENRWRDLKRMSDWV